MQGGADFGQDLIPQGGLPGLPTARAPQPKPREQRKKLQELANRLRDPNAPKLKDFQAPGRAQSEPRIAPALRRPGQPHLPRAVLELPPPPCNRRRGDAVL